MAEDIRTLLLLGGTGDLAGRLLLPALGQLIAAEESRQGLLLLGSGTEDWSQDQWRDRVRTSFDAGAVSGPAIDQVVESTRYQQADVSNADDLRALLDLAEGVPALYFALPPSVTIRACAALRSVELPEGTALVLEKPFGSNQQSAHQLNTILADLVPEEQIHRVDHFLGKSTVLNLLGLRFANRLFEPLWNAEHVARVDIVFDEPLTLENRARYYDSAGALQDMIQSHLLQILALVAMDPPATIDALDLRDAKAQVLRSCRVWRGDAVKSARRARYTAGSIAGRNVPDYAEEPGVDPSRETETLAEVVVEVDNWRWSGVPFRLRSGKALGERRKEVIITYQPAHHIPSGLRGNALPTVLRIVMGPDHMALDMNVNGPDDPLVLDRVTLDADLAPGRLPAYGEVLAGVLDGDPMLSVRSDTAEECWRIVDPVLAAWRNGEVPLDEYTAGSSGPAAWQD